jgi:hypothetical protein
MGLFSWFRENWVYKFGHCTVLFWNVTIPNRKRRGTVGVIFSCLEKEENRTHLTTAGRPPFHGERLVNKTCVAQKSRPQLKGQCHEICTYLFP